MTSSNKSPIDLIPARVATVSLSGLSRTKDDYVHRIMCDLHHNVSNFSDLVVKTKEVRDTLMQIGSFKEVTARIEVAPNTSYDYVVEFDCSESGRLRGNIGTEINHNGASTKVHLETPNLWGRGEKIEFNVSNTNTTMNSEHNWGFNVKLFKPFLHTKLGRYKPTTHLHLFGVNTKGYGKSYNLYTRGGIWDFSFMSSEHLQHTFQYELAFRELGFNSRQVPLSIREHFGPRLGSFLRYIMHYDDRETCIFPNRGTFFRVCLESDIFSNLGNIHYQNATVQIEHNVHLFKGFSLQLTGRGGLLENKLHPERPIPLNNLFLVGGPLTLRGFECLGPFDDNFPLGSNMYWSTGIHLWAPLPFNSYFHNYGKYFRTHVFYNLGNNNRDPNKIRSSCGLGIAVSILQLARIEINYHIPVRYQPGDRLKDGFDFNIGVDFV